MKVQSVIAILVSTLVVSSVARAGGKPSPWRSLDDDSSRSQLFEEHVVPASTPGEGSKALDGPFMFPQNAVSDHGLPRRDSIFGIDISHWTSADPSCKRPLDTTREIDFSTLAKQHVRFVYVKATQGVGYRDCRFQEYWKALGRVGSKVGPLRGSYHFLTADSSGLDQAKSYLRLRKESGGFDGRELPPTLDLEWDKTKSVPDRWATKKPEEIVDSAIEWLSHVEQQTGRRPMIYTSNAWLTERGLPQEQLTRLAAYPLWVADYSQSRRAVEEPSHPGGTSWTLWQFTERSRLSLGAAVLLDASIFKGTESEFASRMKAKAD